MTSLALVASLLQRKELLGPLYQFVVWDTGYQFLLHGAVASYVTTTVFKPSDVLKFGATNKKVSIRTNTHGFVFAVLIFNPIFFTVLL